ncbi:MAG TPA: F0F1 ATP synthase subunit epsilon [Kofleriaceae bacterium]|nr:F0F1 ATP synthase subunit epsilon [Kofleriaceae bacterium]
MADPKQLHGDGGTRGLSTELRVHMVTPRGRIAQATTDAVTAPGELGEFEVLPGHVPMLAELHPGVLTIGDHERQVYAVGRGYLRVDGDGNTEIMVEDAVGADGIDEHAAVAELHDLADQLEDWTEPQNAAWKTLKGRHDWAQARVQAARARHH